MKVERYAIFLVTVSTLLLITACVGARKGRTLKKSISDEYLDSENKKSEDSREVVDEEYLDSVTSANPMPAVELQHFIDPVDGNYRSKVTISRSYSGKLYISGINLRALKDKHIEIKFYLGNGISSPIVRKNVQVVNAPGLTQNSDIAVLEINMGDQPFKDVNLAYDLYDYGSYNSSDDHTQDPFNNRLYCRGLRLEHDPTFVNGQTVVDEGKNDARLCDYSTDICRYAYAKVVDRGLAYKIGAGYIFTTPTSPNIDQQSGSGGDYSDAASETARTNNLKKCLPDNGEVKYNNTNSALPYLDFVAGTTTASLGDVVVHKVAGVDYYYRGPYQSIGRKSNFWEIGRGAIYGSNGIFQAENVDGVDTQSLLFPRSGKMDLTSGISYVGSLSSDLQKILNDGKTVKMDGCNIRASQKDIGRCNVTALVEITVWEGGFATDRKKVFENSYSKLKLQLVRSTRDNLNGDDLLNKTSCSDGSNSCAGNECCFNKKCWSKDLVSQCGNDSDSIGLKKTNESCASDLSCSSLCCNNSSGVGKTCGVHNTLFDPPVLCAKSAGESCIAKSWCKKYTIRKCFIIKTGISPQGKLLCNLKCYISDVHGSCKGGKCQAPLDPPVPSFDIASPDCSAAQEPPTDL